MKYSLWITLWKGFWTWAQTAGVVGAGSVIAVDWPEDPQEYTIQMWMMFLITLVPAVWKVIENWRKNSGLDGKPRWNWPWKTIASIALIVSLSGCATNQHSVIEHTYNDDGTPASTLEVVGKTISTWGSEQSEGAGEMYYTGEADKFEMATGNSVVQQQAGSADQVIIALIEMLMQRSVPEEPDPSVIETAIERYFNADTTN